jgi:pimeloyl-ACP methyl ester carboxylesterase
MTDSGYAPAGDVQMYYEIHGSGPPLVLLHGAYMNADNWGPLLPGLAETHQVIAFEARGHGRTADADGPITYELMADDHAAAMRHLNLGEADVVGYSMGAGTALQLAIRHPDLVRRLVVASGSFRYDGMQPSAIEMFPTMTFDLFEGGPMEAEYKRLAPDPDGFRTLFDKLKALDSTPFAWPEDDIRAIPAPTLIILGDSDVVTLEHAVEMYRLRGGGEMGDFDKPPASQLAVLPGTSHYMPPGYGVLDRHELLLAVIRPFLDQSGH